MIFTTDVSPDFRWRPQDAKVAKELLKREGTPEAIKYFAAHCKQLTSYSYWYLLSVCWVSYNGFTDLALWKQLFAASRKNRESSIMKPSELNAFRKLPSVVHAFRAHRSGETDWIAYTRSAQVAARFCFERGISEVSLYEIDKTDIVALFLRRGESEIVMLDKDKARFLQTVPVVMHKDES